MIRNAKYQRLTLAIGKVGILLRAASLESALRILAVLMLTLASTAQDAVAQSQHIYVVNARSNTVSVLDRYTNNLLTTIAVGPIPVAIAVAQPAARAYVANSGSNTVSVIDTAHDTLVATVQVGSSPVSILAGARQVYVANARSNSVSVIDTITQVVVATVPVGPFPNKLTYSADGLNIWVTNAGDHSVSVIDPGSNTVVATVQVGANPFDIAAPEPAPSCTDQKVDGFETDVDCGGPVCPKCSVGLRCLTNSDCTSNYCNTTSTMGGPPPFTCQPHP
ncbi:YncE family protein [Burkholderia sp. Ac-20353]|uniref:YncE family protein n=1 Tax=Burkholderia sp. Ac-20353 TaxID=2703894 RepID=UPI00197C98B6|nr:YncE family protein [Burkholderia sp. Ac-20353]MBN3786745.1 YncE family protein [Burkholderia sp. Ac-20353]